MISERCGKCRLELERDPESGYWYHAPMAAEQDADHPALLGTPVPAGVVIRDRYDVEHEVEAVDIPPPSVPARPPTNSEVPPAAARFARKADAAGWVVTLSYAKGPLLDATGTKILSRDAETIVVKGRCPVGLFDATWLYRPNLTDPSWAFDGAWASSTHTDGFTHLNSRELSRFLTGGDPA